jgi:hypothetical protein
MYFLTWETVFLLCLAPDNAMKSINKLVPIAKSRIHRGDKKGSPKGRLNLFVIKC